MIEGANLKRYNTAKWKLKNNIFIFHELENQRKAFILNFLCCAILLHIRYLCHLLSTCKLAAALRCHLFVECTKTTAYNYINLDWFLRIEWNQCVIVYSVAVDNRKHVGGVVIKLFLFHSSVFRESYLKHEIDSMYMKSKDKSPKNNQR